MATLSSLVEAIARIEGVDPLQVGWIARQLREAELIRKGGRGRGGARMQPDDAVNLLIGVNATGSPKEAVAAVAIYRSLIWRSDEKLQGRDWEADREDPFKAVFRVGVTFAEALEKILLMAVPVFKPISELEEALNREDVELHIEFIRPRPSVSISIFNYEEPAHDEDTPHGFVLEHGVFVPRTKSESLIQDRTDRVRITERTILGVGRALAS